MSKVKAVAAAIVFMLGASVSNGQINYGQTLTVPPYSQTPYGQQELASRNPYTYIPLYLPQDLARMYVACWAEVPSHNTAYFSATFPSSTVSSARKEFRQLVTTQYGAVSNLQCAGKFNETVVNEQVEKWRDSARSKNAIVDTDWRPVAALSQPLPSAQATIGPFDQSLKH